MKSSPPLQDEKRRLGVFRQHEVPDTPLAEAFNHLTAPTAQTTGCCDHE